MPTENNIRLDNALTRLISTLTDLRRYEEQRDTPPNTSIWLEGNVIIQCQDLRKLTLAGVFTYARMLSNDTAQFVLISNSVGDQDARDGEIETNGFMYMVRSRGFVHAAIQLDGRLKSFADGSGYEVTGKIKLLTPETFVAGGDL